MREPSGRPSEPPDERETRLRHLYGPDGRYVERVETSDERPVGVVTDPEWEDTYAEAEDRWAPALSPRRPTIDQIVALAVGVFFLVFGGLALASVGVQDLTAQTTVGGVSHTGLLALIEIGFGAFMVLAGAIPGASRGLMPLLGAIALAWGIVVVLQPSILSDLLAMEQANGWIYLIAGVITILAAMFAPTYVGRRKVQHRYYSDTRR